MKGAALGRGARKGGKQSEAVSGANSKRLRDGGRAVDGTGSGQLGAVNGAGQGGHMSNTCGTLREQTGCQSKQHRS